MITRLYVLFDAECAMCVRCRDWLSRQDALVPLIFIPLRSPDLAERFHGIDTLNPREQLLMVGDDGSVYRGASSWIMCLWALDRYRDYAQRLSHPALLPFAKIVCELLSKNRFFLSRTFFKEEEKRLAKHLAAHVPILQPGQSACAR